MIDKTKSLRLEVLVGFLHDLITKYYNLEEIGYLKYYLVL